MGGVWLCCVTAVVVACFAPVVGDSIARLELFMRHNGLSAAATTHERRRCEPHVGSAASSSGCTWHAGVLCGLTRFCLVLSRWPVGFHSCNAVSQQLQCCWLRSEGARQAEQHSALEADPRVTDTTQEENPQRASTCRHPNTAETSDSAVCCSEGRGVTRVLLLSDRVG